MPFPESSSMEKEKYPLNSENYSRFITVLIFGGMILDTGVIAPIFGFTSSLNLLLATSLASVLYNVEPAGTVTLISTFSYCSSSSSPLLSPTNFLVQFVLAK